MTVLKTFKDFRVRLVGRKENRKDGKIWRDRKENDFPSYCLVNRKERKDHFITFTVLPLYYIFYIKFFWIRW